MQLKRSDIQRAKRPTQWDLSNQLLYGLCESHFRHTTRTAVVAKSLVIGRVYAAALERRRVKDKDNDSFYSSSVVPIIMKSGIDGWIDRARRVAPQTQEGLDILVDVHGRLTDRLKLISDHNNRAFASKYLHFHVPGLFYIYDSRANRGLSKLKATISKGCRTERHGDDQYRRFAEKCYLVQRHCRDHFGEILSPRQLDNLLLRLSET